MDRPGSPRPGSPEVELVHALPRRTRLRVAWLPRARGAEARPAVSALGDAVARIAGVRRVEIRAATASVLCEHDPGLGAEALRAAVQEAAAAQAPPPPPAAATRASGATIARQLTALFHDANQRLLAITEGRLDLGTFASLGLVGASAVHVASTGRLSFPRWSDLAWWATQTFASFEHPEAAAKR